MALYREAKREFPPETILKEVKIDASTRFEATSENLIISPLKNAADLYLVSMHEGMEDAAKLKDIKADEYTQVNGLIRGTKLYVDTDEIYYVKFN